MAGVQQNITYRKELFPGDVMEVRSRVLEVGDKRIRFAHEMRNIETRRGRGRCELTAVHLDKIAHKSMPFPPRCARRPQALAAGGTVRCSLPPSGHHRPRPIARHVVHLRHFRHGGRHDPARRAATFMDVAPAMMLFGTIQMASNGWRATLWLRYVDWSIVWRFLVGSTLMFLAAALGRDPAEQGHALPRARPVAVRRLPVPKRLSLDITRPGVPYFAGALSSCCS